MKVFIYQAALLCEACGIAQRGTLTVHGKRPADPEDESSYDSDQFPKGPYPDGGGESDSPEHCDHCRTFLFNPLTPDGYEMLRRETEEFLVRDDDGTVDVEASAAKAQEDADCTDRGINQSDDDDAPLAQWLRYYPEAWESANGWNG